VLRDLEHGLLTDAKAPAEGELGKSTPAVIMFSPKAPGSTASPAWRVFAISSSASRLTLPVPVAGVSVALEAVPAKQAYRRNGALRRALSLTDAGGQDDPVAAHGSPAAAGRR